MLSLLQGSSSAKEQRNGGGSGWTHLYLNVYDLSPINDYLYWFGLGIFHSGIEVYGMEYGFGAHELASSGVFEVEPRTCPGFVYRRTVYLGTTHMSRAEFRSFIEQLSLKYHGDTYHLISKNCNHFTNDVCLHLTGKRIPRWVNRLAKLGSLCNCFLPESIQVSAIGHLTEHPEFLEGGSDSYASSSSESDDEGPDHHLLTAPNSEPSSHLREKPLKLARDVL